MKRHLLVPILSVPVLIAIGALGLATPASADTDDFTFSSFDGAYHLSRADDGTSVLETTETLVAEFPDFDQNHGIVRGIPEEFDGHPLDLQLDSVTDASGTALPYESESDDGELKIRIGDEDDYVRGQQTYVITYRQHNVTRYYRDTDAQEFYWDTTGTDSPQPFARVTATVTIDPALAGAMRSDAVDAAAGYEGRDDVPVDVSVSGGTITATATDLAAGQNVSVAVPFEPGTFAERRSGFFDAAWPGLSAFGVLLGLLALVLAIRVRMTRLRDAPGRGTIIPEYEPPADVPLGVSAVLLGKTGKLTPATLLDLAVRGFLRIVEDSSARKPSFGLEFVTSEGADQNDLDFLHAIFGDTLTPGEDRDLAKKDEKAAKRIAALLASTKAATTSLGFRARVPYLPVAGVIALGGIGVLLGFVFGTVSLDQVYGGFAPLVTLALSIAIALVIWIVLAKRPLTERGSLTREHLAGLRTYIDWAEADRIRFLQSPEGAERMPVDTSDSTAVLKLNERLLPYAVLFGTEKRWAAELGRSYEQTGEQPSWYWGAAGFNVGYFSAGIGSISTSAASTYTSSSGGSGGGAVSGGGGGGGSVGGW